MHWTHERGGDYRDAMFDLDRFIADCRAALAGGHPAGAVRELTERAVTVPGEIEAALGSPRLGGLFTLHHAPDLTVLNVVWAPGMAIYPHEHRMWAVIGLYGGREDNTFYRRGERGLAIVGGKQLERSETALLGEAAIHSVVNPLQGFTAAVHVYGGDFFGKPRSEWTPDTLEERPFDVERARRAYASANERPNMGKA
jgi:predicted metal-dependent enzyme (double-stranded beta helix superfamily)